jgi:hypothetical protein
MQEALQIYSDTHQLWLNPHADKETGDTALSIVKRWWNVARSNHRILASGRVQRLECSRPTFAMALYNVHSCKLGSDLNDVLAAIALDIARARNDLFRFMVLLFGDLNFKFANATVGRIARSGLEQNGC